MSDHPLSVPDFRRLLMATPVEEIPAIALSAVPERLPRRFLAELPEAMRPAVEGLLFDAAAHHLARRTALEACFGGEVLAAVEQAEGRGRGERFAHLREKVAEIARLHKERDEEDQVVMAILGQKIQEATDQVEELRRDTRQLFQARDRLLAFLDDPTQADAQSLALVRSALQLLDHEAEHLEAVLAQFFYVRLVVSGQEMRRLKARIDEVDQQFLVIQRQIDSYRQELELLRQQENASEAPSRARQARFKHLEDAVRTLKSEQSFFEAFVSEAALLDWLDSFVNASLSPVLRERVGRFARSIEIMLLELLEHYCARQEAAARHIARHPGMHANPRELIQFVLRSERFVLEYFANKRARLKDWLGSAAQHKLGELERLEASLLTEMEKRVHRVRAMPGP